MIEINKIYEGDCILKMQEMENESIDLIIADLIIFLLFKHL